MPPLRIAHLSDTHLGYRALYKADPVSGRNQRAVDVERAYEAVVSDLLTREVDLVIHGGDVFHHARPTYSAMRAFVRQTRRLEAAGLPVMVIGGNHDTPRLRTSGSVFSVLDLALPGVEFVTGYELDVAQDPRVVALNVNLVAIPHGKLVDPIAPIVFPEAGKINLLVTHGLVPGIEIKGRQREPGEEEIGETLLDAEFDYIALGHYHEPSRPRRNAWYSGSTERIGWGDERVEPGYNLVEIAGPGAEPVVTHVPIEARPMRTLPPIDGEGYDTTELVERVMRLLEELRQPNALVRVELRNTPRPIRREVESILRRESQSHVWWLQTHAQADLLAPFREREETVPTDILAMFDEFVAERAYEPAFAAAYAERGRKALEDAMRDLEGETLSEEGAA